MKPLKPIVKFVVAVALLLGFIFSCNSWRDRQWLLRGVPEGFYLECDGKGNYRALYESGTPLTSLDGNQTKSEAIRRAWHQFDYEAELNSHKWRRVK